VRPFEIAKDFIIDQLVGYGTEKEWDLVGLGEGERGGYAYILGVDRH
jgi:hypothetical protein